MSGNIKVGQAHYVGSFPTERACPRSSKPEYAFIGRSNVGKSSLINMLLGRKDLARTSKSPGKTQTINIYSIDSKWHIADLPGYGYAKVSKAQRKRWQQMIEGYMMFRPNLVTAFVLIDIRHDLQAADRDFINWLGARRVPFALVFTKADKIKPAQIAKFKKGIEQDLLAYWDELPLSFVTSSASGQGREHLLEYITELNERIENETI